MARDLVMHAVALVVSAVTLVSAAKVLASVTPVTEMVDIPSTNHTTSTAKESVSNLTTHSLSLS